MYLADPILGADHFPVDVDTVFLGMATGLLSVNDTAKVGGANKREKTKLLFATERSKTPGVNLDADALDKSS